jgi:hypothetical protein
MAQPAAVVAETVVAAGSGQSSTAAGLDASRRDLTRSWRTVD